MDHKVADWLRSLLREPSSLDELSLVSVVGRGGAGEVWKAWDHRLLRWVAVKRGSARFEIEARAAAKLVHPNIVPIYRVERDYLVMPLIEGRTLDELRLAPRRALEVMSAIARAVQYAHDRGVVHRDLKPGNIILDSQDHPWMFDFGLAHLTEDAITHSKTTMGTPEYMSPEQILSNSREPSTDIYSLGATLYQLISGRAPFTVHRLANQEPPRLGRGDVRTIVEKAMEIEPSRRYASAGEFADDIDRVLRGEPIHARPRLMRFPKWLAAAGILAAVVIYLRSQRDVMEELSTIAPEKISAFIERNPDLPHGYYVRARNVSWREAEPDLQRALRLDPKFGPAWTLLGRVRIEQYQDRLWGDPETFRRNMKAAEPILREAQAAFEKGGFDDVLGQAMFTYYIEGDKERGKRLLESAPPSPEVYHWRGVMGGPKENIEWQTRALRLDPAYLPAIYSRGLARVVSGDCRGGIEDLSMSIQASPRNPHAWFYRGIARNRLNDAAGALEDCRRAVELLPEYGQAWALSAQIKLARKDYEGALSDALRSSLLDAFLVRAQAHMFRGRLAEAERVYDEIIERWPRTGPAYASRGLCAFTLNRPVDADRDFERALELMGEGDPNRALVSQWRTRVRRHFEY